MMKKFFMLSAAVLLSIAASAQDEIKHRFPEVKFTIKGESTNTEYTIPAWDVRFTSDGYIRIQKKKILGEREFLCRLVGRFAYYNGEENYKIPKETDTLIVNGKEYKANELKYSAVVPAGYATGESWAETNYANYEVITFKRTNKFALTSAEYTVPTINKTDQYGDFIIDEIAPYTYRNSSLTENSPSNWAKPKALIIPSGIKKIGRGAFFNLVDVKKVTIEGGGELNELPVQAFMNCINMKEITIPENVKTINGAALGGCTVLGKINFESTTSPESKTVTIDDSTYTAVQGTGSRKNFTKGKCVVNVPEGAVLNYATDETNTLWKYFIFASPFTIAKDAVTFCSPYYFTIRDWDYSKKVWKDGPREDLKAFYPTKAKTDNYAAKASEGKIVLKQITTSHAPKKFGLYLKGTAGTYESVFFPPYNSKSANGVGFLNTDAEKNNMLVGVTEDTYLTDIIQKDSENDYYVLKDGVFQPCTGGTLKAGKAYLKVPIGTFPTNPSAPNLMVSFEGDDDAPTGIQTVGNESENAEWYSLEGVKTSSPKNGIYVKNGKKIIVK